MNVPSSKLNYINLGCGTKTHPDWVNADLFPRDPQVIHCDFLKGIPFPDNSFEVVYHSQVLEHFTRTDGDKLIEECYRVLKPGGRIRVVLPDLEGLIREYIKWLDTNLANPTDENETPYLWTLLQMFDQGTRNQGGGEMLTFVQQDKISNEAFVREMGGGVIQGLIDYFRAHPEERNRTFQPDSRSTFRKVLSLLKPGNYKAKLQALVLSPEEQEYLAIGKFRKGGEIHYWMYDRYSLGRLMSKKGFTNVKQHSPKTSDIGDWGSFHLDIAKDGTIRDGYSLYMEGQKPF